MSDVRRTEVLSAFDTLFRVYDRWQSKPVETFPLDMEDCLNSLFTIFIDGGDIPHELLTIVPDVNRLHEMWRALKKGEGRADRDGIPTRGFWNLFLHVRECIDRQTDQAEEEPLPPVSDLLIELKPHPYKYQQIARIYGARNPETDQYEGPFFDRSGSPVSSLIEKEGKEPGSVIKKQPETKKQQQASRLDQARQTLQRYSGASTSGDYITAAPEPEFENQTLSGDALRDYVEKAIAVQDGPNTPVELLQAMSADGFTAVHEELNSIFEELVGK